jgi:hypothetical protein
MGCRSVSPARARSRSQGYQSRLESYEVVPEMNPESGEIIHLHTVELRKAASENPSSFLLVVIVLLKGGDMNVQENRKWGLALDAILIILALKKRLS